MVLSVGLVSRMSDSRREKVREGRDDQKPETRHALLILYWYSTIVDKLPVYYDTMTVTICTVYDCKYEYSAINL